MRSVELFFPGQGVHDSDVGCYDCGDNQLDDHCHHTFEIPSALYGNRQDDKVPFAALSADKLSMYRIPGWGLGIYDADSRYADGCLAAAGLAVDFVGGLLLSGKKEKKP